MRLPRRRLVLVLAVVTLPLGAAVAATTAHQRADTTAQTGNPPHRATPPAQALAAHPPRPELTPASRVSGSRRHLTPDEQQQLATASLPPSVTPGPSPSATATGTPGATPTASPTASATATASATPTRTATPTPTASSTPTPGSGSPTPTATAGP